MTMVLGGKVSGLDGSIGDATIAIRDGLIESLDSDRATIGFDGCTILPGFIDIHIHGSHGHDVMDSDQAALDDLGLFLAGRGVTSYLATTVTAPLDRLLTALDRIGGIIERGRTKGAQPVGIHLEGPFISHAKCGVHPTGDLLEPSLELFEKFWQASHGWLKIMTIAPELPNALEVIARATALGVRVSLGHSNATLAETLPAIAAGAASATHVFNAMRALDHREPGILGAVLDGELYCELIADGVHVDPLVIRLLARAKRHDRIVLITDAISATGMPDGRYKLGNLDVDVANGECRHDGMLAGSVLTLDRGVANFAGFTGLSPAQCAMMATENPARLLGLADRGRIAPGCRADLAVHAPDGRIIQSFVGGVPVIN
jgi:N-acetylglucosamine-6-phosphate deacetylase